MRAVECHGFSPDTGQRKNFWECDITLTISRKWLINPITSQDCTLTTGSLPLNGRLVFPQALGCLRGEASALLEGADRSPGSRDICPAEALVADAKVIPCNNTSESNSRVQTFS